MNIKLLAMVNLFLLAAASPVTGDTRDVKFPIIIAVIAVILIVVSIALGSKSKKDKK